MKAVSILISTNFALRLKKSLNELRVIDIYIMDKMLSIALFSLAYVIIHYMRDTVTTKKANRIFGYPLLLTDIFCHFSVNLSSEQGENTNASDIVSGLTISRSGFGYD